jgi:diguanylate cyclase (GGDEF)-like protein
VPFAEIFTNLMQVLLVTGLAFVIICGLTSVLRFQQMASRASAVSSDDEGGNAAFQIQVAERLGTAHRGAATFSMLAVGIHDFSTFRDQLGDETLAELRQSVAETIRKGIREVDSLLRIADDRFGMLAAANREVAREIAQRIVVQFSDLSFCMSDEQKVRIAVHVAIVVSPDSGTRVTELMDTLETTMEQSAAQGENAVVIAGGDEAVSAPAPVPTAEDPLAAIPSDQRKLVDPVTGVLREDYLGGVLQKRMAQKRRDEQPVSIVCLQIDHLDRYRDHYGEEGVGVILGHFGAFLQRSVRESDLLGRVGEEQILIIMGCPPLHAQVASQRLIHAMRDEVILVGGDTLNLTLSGGVSGFPTHGGVAKKLLEYALQALEVAKANGRNQSRLFDRDQDLPQAARPTVDTF